MGKIVPYGEATATKKSGVTNQVALLSAGEKAPKSKHLQLQEDYTFSNYIVEENNRSVVNAAIEVSKNPGKSYNPFFIYSGVGLGKTHLMHAIGNSVYENSDSKVICVTSEEFIVDYIESVHLENLDVFKNKYYNADVLLIDDIQNFQGKYLVQELFLIFKELIKAKKQLVFTCPQNPLELKFSKRLLNHFSLGEICEIQRPSYEIRCAILKSLVADCITSISISIPDEIIELMAKYITSNIRALKGALNTFIAYWEITGQPIPLELVRHKLQDVLEFTH